MPSRVYVSSDGEAVVLNQVFSEDTLTLLKDKNIAMGKISASCSGIHQPSDVSPLFRAAKKHLHTFTDHNPECSDLIFKQAMDTAIKSFEHESKLSLSSEQKGKIIYGCWAVANTLQETIRVKVIRDGFSLCGQYPFDFAAIMRQGYRKLSVAELNRLQIRMEIDEEFFREHGQLTEEQMDLSGIPTIIDESSSVPRHERQLINQRAVLITHKDTILRQQEAINSGMPLGNAIVTLQTPQERREAKTAAKNVAANEKKIAKALAEANRKASMTKEQLDAEKLEKKIATEAKKKEKAQKLNDSYKLINKLKTNI